MPKNRMDRSHRDRMDTAVRTYCNTANKMTYNVEKTSGSDPYARTEVVL